MPHPHLGHRSCPSSQLNHCPKVCLDIANGTNRNLQEGQWIESTSQERTAKRRSAARRLEKNNVSDSDLVIGKITNIAPKAIETPFSALLCLRCSLVHIAIFHIKTMLHRRAPTVLGVVGADCFTAHVSLLSERDGGIEMGEDFVVIPLHLSSTDDDPFLSQ